MTFDIEYSTQSFKFLKNVDNTLRKRLLRKIENLRIEPFPSDTKSVEGFKAKLFRVRVGNQRILYIVRYNPNKLLIVKVDKRPRVYQ